jgi:hypothetical protein
VLQDYVHEPGSNLTIEVNVYNSLKFCQFFLETVGIRFIVRNFRDFPFLPLVPHVKRIPMQEVYSRKYRLQTIKTLNNILE